jgi:magnesium chelatase family protein
VADTRERVRAALASIGLALPPKVITVNLSPADLPKEGSHYDLPIALCLLAAIGATDAETLSHYVAVGELCLDGRIAPSAGVLLAAIHASGLDKGLICPAAQGSEASWAGELDVIAAPDLLALLSHLKGTALIGPPAAAEAEPPGSGPDLAQVKGQEVAKRALGIAAAGGHNLLLLWTEALASSKVANVLSKRPSSTPRLLVPAGRLAQLAVDEVARGEFDRFQQLSEGLAIPHDALTRASFSHWLKGPGKRAAANRFAAALAAKLGIALP